MSEWKNVRRGLPWDPDRWDFVCRDESLLRVDIEPGGTKRVSAVTVHGEMSIDDMICLLEELRGKL